MKIAIIGNSHTGKSTVMEMLKEYATEQVEIVKFADNIYDALPRGEKNREFMCKYGDFLKDLYGSLIFCELFTEKVTMIENEAELCGAGVTILCDDVRLPAEAEVAKKAGFKLIAIDCPHSAREARARCAGFEIDDSHNSESQVAETSLMADYVISNTGSLEELLAMVKVIKDRI